MEDHGNENDNANFSVKQLKVNLKNTLKNSGVLSTVKAQIRQEFINGLTAKNRENAAKALSMSDRIMYSSIYHLLRNRRLVNSISVFSAESGLDPKLSLISEDDIIRMIKFNGLANTYKFLQNGVSSNQTEDSLVPTSHADGDKRSILDVMMQFCLSAGEGTKEMSAQTETGGPSAREILDDRIHELRRTYQVSKEVQSLSPNKTIEERMVAYQRDCEKRLARDLEIQVTHIRENEISRVRLEEQSRAHEEMENMRKRLEFEYSKRLQAHIEVESDSAKRLVDQEHAMQRALYENRQFMQREIDELRSRESAATRRMELEAQGVRALEHRLKESLRTIETREADIARRERVIEEARLGHYDVAQKEALARVQGELEILSRERSALMMEKQHFADEVGMQKALVSSALALKAQLKAQAEELTSREEEVLAMRRAAQRLQLQRDEEDAQIKKMLDQIDPNLATFTRCEQIVALIQQKADLQVQLANFRDAHMLQQRLAKMEEDLSGAQAELRESRLQQDAQANQAALEREHLERAVLAERAKVASHVHKLDELRQLLHDKTLTVDSLRRQLESGATSGGTGFTPSPSQPSRSLLQQTQQRVHMSQTDQRAVDLLRRNGNYADAERAEGYPSHAGSAQNPSGSGGAGSLIDSVIQRLLQEQAQTQRSAVPVPPPAAQFVSHQTYGAVAPPGYQVPVPAAAAPIQPAIDHAQQMQAAQHAAAMETQRLQAAQLAHTLHQEQLKAAEMKTQIEQQKLEQERLALSMQRERLEAQQRQRESDELQRDKEREREKDAVRERERQAQLDNDRELNRQRDREREREREIEEQRQKEKERLNREATAHSISVSSYVAPPTVTIETELAPPAVASHQNLARGSLSHSPSDSRSNSASGSDADDSLSELGDVYLPTGVAASPPKQQLQSAEASDAQRKRRDAEVQEVEQQRKMAEEAAAREAATAARAKEEKEKEEETRRRAREKDLERQREQADEWERAEQQKKDDALRARDVAAKAQLAREKEKEEERQEDERQRLAEEQREKEEEQQRVHDAQAATQHAEEEKKRQQEEQDAEARRQEELNSSAHLRARQEEEERVQREREEEERVEAAREAELEKERQKQQEADEIMAARQKVLERRRLAADRNKQLSSSLPMSLQAVAAANSENNNAESASTSQNQSTLSHLGSAMMPGVSTSLDSAAQGGFGGAGGNRATQGRNLFPSSFQNLHDSDSSSDRMETGDMSEDQENSGMF